MVITSTNFSDVVETSLACKKRIYNILTIVDTTNAKYKHAKRNCNDFRIQILGEFHNYKYKMIHYYW